MNPFQLIQEAFSKQASRFEEQGLTLANREYLQWMTDSLTLQSHFQVLDVAAGTGHLSRAMAPRVKQVIAIDATPAMLAQGKHSARQANLKNIFFLRGFAETLPFPNNTFDRVVCRFALHHFMNPWIQVQEMVRVCRPNGKVGIIDLVAPENEVWATNYNRIERLRDPSHRRALPATELHNLLQEAGLSEIYSESRRIEVNVQRWLDLTDPDPETRQAILEELSREIQGSGSTGLDPFMRDKELMFFHTWMILVGTKEENTK
jgi:ubiquinone/menaquinone biosynthesis C-methylase UbiE